MDITDRLDRWSPPDDWLKIKTIDTHTEGEPLRVIIGDYPDLLGDTILEHRQYAIEYMEHIRTALMWEPRGHPDMYGCIIVPPVSKEADFGVLFFHNEGYSSMCGHGIIAITKVVLQTAMFPMSEPETTVRIDTPSGLVKAFAVIENGEVRAVRFHNVPSFVAGLDETVEVPGLGQIKYDLAFGGAFYAYVKASDAEVTCLPDDYDNLIRKGRQIKNAIAKSRPVAHPFEEELSFLYGTIFTGPTVSESADIRNVCIFADGEVDRSPTGTGVSGRLAIQHARGEINVGDPLVVESIIGTKFTGRVVRETNFGQYKAIIPEIEGSAYITGRHEFLIDPDDPLKEGFFLR
jgi:trans-L-3-hydroxyproline dehydratase